MRREWIEMIASHAPEKSPESPSMRREWIEIDILNVYVNGLKVSLHAEGVD